MPNRGKDHVIRQFSTQGHTVQFSWVDTDTARNEIAIKCLEKNSDFLTPIAGFMSEKIRETCRRVTHKVGTLDAHGVLFWLGEDIDQATAEALFTNKILPLFPDAEIIPETPMPRRGGTRGGGNSRGAA